MFYLKEHYLPSIWIKATGKNNFLRDKYYKRRLKEIGINNEKNNDNYILFNRVFVPLFNIVKLIKINIYLELFLDLFIMISINLIFIV